MVERPERPDWLVQLTYELRGLVHRGKLEQLQRSVERAAKDRGLTPWELTQQIADVGIELGIATPIEQVASEDLVQ
jgi:hypothetical protein